MRVLESKPTMPAPGRFSAPASTPTVQTRPTRDMILGARELMLVVQTPTGHRYGYRMSHKDADHEYREAWFIKITDGRTDRYAGKLDDFYGQLVPTRASEVSQDDFAVKLLNKVLTRIWGDELDAVERSGFAVWAVTNQPPGSAR